MRFAARVLVASVFMVCCRGVAAAESGSSWWPFGQHPDPMTGQPAGAAQATLPPAATTMPQTTAPSAGAGPVAHQVQMPSNADSGTDSHWMVNTPQKKVSWPKLEWPKSLSSKSSTPTADTKNKWVEKAPPAPKTSPMQSVKNGAHSVATTTKSAWNKTVAAVTPSSSSKKTAVKPDPKLTARQTSPPFWKKMFGAKEPELQQPQTVPQWMAQKRLDP